MRLSYLLRVVVPALSAFPLLLTGCPSNTAPPPKPPAVKPYDGVTLKIALDPALKRALASRMQGWASRTGAKIETDAPNADVQIAACSTVGQLAEEDKLLPVPAELKAGDHPCQWDLLLRIHRGRLASWGSTVYAIPITVEGTVLVVRKDLLSAVAPKYLAKHNRPLPLPPQTWEDIAEIGEVLKDHGKSALPMLSVNDYLRAAACYGRIAISETDRIQNDKDAKGSKALLSFIYDADSGEPRVNTPGFARAAALFQRLATLQSNATFESGGCAMAFLPLSVVANLATTPLAKQVQFASLPGTRSAYNTAAKKFDELDNGRRNYVPYFFAGQFAVVAKSCANPAAAWDLIADLTGPARTLETFSDPTFGSVPLRSEHQSNETVWQRYGYDPATSAALGAAVRDSLAVTTANATYAPRGPDAAAAMTAFREFVTKLRSNPAVPPEPLLNELQNQLSKPATPDSKTWHRRAAGLN